MDPLRMSQAAQSWLTSTWHIQVPLPWLEACVQWIQDENRSTHMTQVQVNQQVFEQWLLCDLRDLSHPVLPPGASEALKTEVSGFYCLQMDSVVDISQPAYSQLQQWRRKDCSNDSVSAVTQATQRPWEVKPMRMLMLQLTDGVHNLEGMEYKPIPALNTSLRPGTKILLQGTVPCRLGVLLLKPENIKVLGGEVENLVERNSQGKVLCRLLGLPEDITEESAEQPVESQESDEDLTDEILLASLEVDDQVIVSVEASADSGYVSRREPDSGSRQDPSIQNNGSHLEAFTDSPQVVEIVDEDFDDIPFEELESEPLVNPSFSANAELSYVSLSSSTALSKSSSSNGMDQGYNLTKNDPKIYSRGAVPLMSPGSAKTGRGWRHHVAASDDVRVVSEEEMDSAESGTANNSSASVNASITVDTTCQLPGTGSSEVVTDCVPCSNMTAKDCDLRPFTYLSVLRAEKTSAVRLVRVKAFIVTLLGSLLSNTGNWQVKVTISDGSDYLDADLSDSVLVGLIGFSVSESKALKKDPEQRKKVAVGLQNCQKKLVDMCCLMTIEYDSVSSKAVVLSAEEVSVQDYRDLENRVKSRLRC
ncbi:recQ-mediated genome instability protein 1-like [Scleropages formosus]|uniref:RecQ-mediated genome instability protein 1 n=1 Tax=Scleropages formosus TaxID=113540 RepID=A0A0P7UQQ0_SCLFO|nr:recQ-mediated genome instability protein 1 [Scleropages formosus]KPP61826.1 recQ-mediated genome instability protein 1-like [Scleropages formosus]